MINGNLNALQVSRESLQFMVETLDEAQIGKIMVALYQYMYEGIQPEFDDKLMNGVFKTVSSFTEMKAEKFMSQHRNFISKNENPKCKKQPKEEIVEAQVEEVQPEVAVEETKAAPAYQFAASAEEAAQELEYNLQVKDDVLQKIRTQQLKREIHSIIWQDEAESMWHGDAEIKDAYFKRIDQMVKESHLSKDEVDKMFRQEFDRAVAYSKKWKSEAYHY